MRQQGFLLGDSTETIVPFAPRARSWRDEPLPAFQQWIRATPYIPRARKGRTAQSPRPYSPSAQRTYLSIFARYLEHLRARDTSLLSAGPKHVDGFLRTLTGRQDGLASHETKRRALVMLERVYGELIRLQLLFDNPTRPLFRIYATVPTTRAETTVLGAEQLSALLAYITSLPRDTFNQARRAAMLAVMVSCGITGEDLRKVEVRHVARDNGLCINMPKTASRDAGRIHLATFAIPLLERFLELRAQAGVRGPLLFPAAVDGATPISHQSLHRHVVMALEAAGAHQRVGAQRIMRATLAVQMLQANTPPEDVRKTLRLHQMDQVERYQRFKRVLPPF